MESALMTAKSRAEGQLERHQRYSGIARQTANSQIRRTATLIDRVELETAE
jgi:hypothetical protein